MRQFAISDIHGCYRSLVALLDKIAFSTEDELYLLGDFTDRGSNSREVFNHIWKLQSEGYQVHCLRGNHDQMMLDARNNWLDAPLWLKHGGYETLASFGVNSINDVPQKYIDFLNGLPYYYEIGDYILVHAGLNLQRKDPFEDHKSMMWMRPWNFYFGNDWLNGRVMVHGHTPQKKEEIIEQSHKLGAHPALGIDGGCVFPHLGQLCAFQLGEEALFFQQSIG